jgi:hypothetical protein
MDEDVLCATFRCDKAKALRRIEEFHGTDRHDGSFANDRPDGRQDGENIKSGSVWARRARGESGRALLLEQSRGAYAPLSGKIQGGRELRPVIALIGAARSSLRS